MTYRSGLSFLLDVVRPANPDWIPSKPQTIKEGHARDGQTPAPSALELSRRSPSETRRGRRVNRPVAPAGLFSQEIERVEF